MNMPVCPVATKAARAPRACSARAISTAAVILPTLQSLPTVSVTVAATAAARPAATGRRGGVRRASCSRAPPRAAAVANSGSSPRKACSPESTSQPRASASSTLPRHATGSSPPCGATPMSRLSAPATAAAATSSTTGMAPPTPAHSAAVRPARVESITAATSSGR